MGYKILSGKVWWHTPPLVMLLAITGEANSRGKSFILKLKMAGGF